MQPYKRLYTYWFAVVIYDLTVVFCEKYIKSWKLTEQMNGAARSGKQNIVEGSEALQTSLKSGIKLTGVAKASFEELIGDLEDFLRQRNLRQWGKQDGRVRHLREYFAKEIRNLSYLGDLGVQKYKLSGLPEKDANVLLTLCHQETYLLFRQVEGLMKKHEIEGGLTEKLFARRKQRRGY